MNTVCLLAKFEETPTEEEQKLVEVELRSMLSNICSSSNQKMVSGTGSWWIAVSCMVQGLVPWVLEEFASWSISKGLDKLVKEISKGSKSSEIAIPTTELNFETEEKNKSDQGLKQNMEKFSEGVEILKVAKEKMGASEIMLSEWSDTEQKGRILRVSNTENGVTCHMHQTDSKDNFDSYTRTNY